jgi:hypothetical protein
MNCIDVVSNDFEPVIASIPELDEACFCYFRLIKIQGSNLQIDIRSLKIDFYFSDTNNSKLHL